MKRFLAHRPACFGLLLLLLMIMLAAAAGLIQQRLGIDAETLDLMAPAAPASPAHLLGTDEVGRDLLARLLQGSAISLTIGLTTALAAAMIGTLLGIVAGYRGGVLDSLLMRLTDGVIALPLLPLLIVLGAVDPAKLGLSAELLQAPSGSLARTILIIALVGWTTVARLVRAATL
ncbi:MAG TPA: ABC transporter permease subunit, partial [Rhodospirillaceae bacterium]|nr:ABC transporter permease subunit [Rhodospirillaceae bacterium]